MTEAQVDRLIDAIEMLAAAIAGRVAPPETSAPATCTHPREAREDTGSTMGWLRWRCTACGYAHEQPMGVAAAAAQR